MEYNAGDKLDLLIAEKVMKWQRVEVGDDLYLVRPEDKVSVSSWDLEDYIPKYSTEIIDAWRVVEEMMKRRCYFLIEKGETVKYRCVFNDGISKRADCEGQTMELAICYAALEMEEK